MSMISETRSITITRLNQLQTGVSKVNFMNTIMQHEGWDAGTFEIILFLFGFSTREITCQLV
jgi:hypothetical protein